MSARENKMGSMPIPKLLFTIAFPIIISMTIQALYNIVDSIFVAKISEEALTAVSLVFPIQSLMISLAVGTGVAINALISRFLGQKEFALCSKIAKNGIFLSLLNFVIFAIIGVLFSKLFFSMQTDNQLIVTYGNQYMSIVTVCSIGMFTMVTFERFLQATGQTILSMATQGVGAIVNIILDPILIFGLFGFPRLEVVGAAVATVVGQICGALVGFYLVRKHINQFSMSLRNFKPDLKSIKTIYQIGFPAILMQSVGSIMVFSLNSVLLMFSTTATAVFGIYYKLQSFVYMPIFGISNGFLSITAYNFGARHKERIVSLHKLAISVVLIMMLLGTSMFMLMTNPMLSLFEASDEMLLIGHSALQIISISFAFAGFSIIASSLFQALGKAHYSLILSLSRQLLIVVPLAFILAKTTGLNGVWYSIVIAEIISFFVSIVLLMQVYSKVINKL
ncbi:MAG: MATE family efflux transporter [Clostridia bacterium]